MSEFTNNYAEGFSQPQTEYFAEAESIAELTELYHRLTSRAVVVHRRGFENIAKVHDQAVESGILSNNFEASIIKLSMDVDKAVKHVLPPQAVESVIKEAGARAFQMLPEGDKVVANQIRGLSRKGVWLESYRIKELKWQVENPESRKKLTVCLDSVAYDALRRDLQKYGPNSSTIRMAIDSLSSSEVRSFVNGSLDIDRLRVIKEHAKKYGASSRAVKIDIDEASAHWVSRAFKLGLDKEVLEDARSSSLQYGISSFNTRHILSAASSRYAEILIEEILSEELVAQDERSQTKEQARDLEVEAIVARVINGDRDRGRQPDQNASWLQREEPINIRRVINTVRKLREKEGLSDSQIYVKYRKNIEKGEGDKDNPVDPRIENSFKIISVMMGNDFKKGKLPF